MTLIEELTADRVVVTDDDILGEVSVAAADDLIVADDVELRIDAERGWPAMAGDDFGGWIGFLALVVAEPHFDVVPGADDAADDADVEAAAADAALRALAFTGNEV